MDMSGSKKFGKKKLENTYEPTLLLYQNTFGSDSRTNMFMDLITHLN